MGAGIIGFVLGTFIAHGVLPGAFILYGRRNRKDWGVVLGLVLVSVFALAELNQAMRGNTSFWAWVGIVPAWLLCAAVFFAKPSAESPPTS